jgi:16S rRNA (adenine1518-N6/adenine1519-N6)-dimethyltransferase
MQNTPSPNQTLTFLMRRFAEVGIRPKTRHGQNFLIDLNLLRVLVDAAQLEPNDVVLEVGTGTGSLTGILAQRVAEVISIEVDSQMHLLASEELVDFQNVTLLKLDALRNKNHLNDIVLDTVRERLAAKPGRRFKLVANLPYNIATPILSNLLTTDPLPATMTATIQKELADRIVAAPRTKDYGALSVWMQSQCSVRIVRTMPPTAFWPQPKVTSAIVQIELQPELRARIADPDFFHATVRSLFFHRRKFLRSVVLSGFKDRLGKPEVDEVLASLGFTESTRAEELDVATMMRLSEALQAKLQQVGASKDGQE